MIKRTKKKAPKALMPIIMLGITACLLAGYVLLDGDAQTNENNTANNDTSSSVTVIHEKDASSITYLSYTMGEGSELSFSRESGKWTYAGDPKYPLSSDCLDSMAAVVSYIGVYRTLDDGDTGVYGFDTPSLTFYAEYYDGSNCHYAVGDQNPMTGYLYLKDLDAGVVYTVDPAILPYFEFTLEDMFAYDTLGGDIEKDYITSIVWTDGETKTLESLADTQAETIYAAYQALTPTTPADWSGTEDALAAYGIMDGATFTIHYRRAVTSADESGNELTTRVASSYTIRFGTESDGMIPYQLPGTSVIYLVESDTISPLFALFE